MEVLLPSPVRPTIPVPPCARCRTRGAAPFGVREGGELHEFLLVTLDKKRLPRDWAMLGIPGGEVPRAVVPRRGPVDARRVRPNAEVADVQSVIEHHAQRGVEGQHRGVEGVEGPTAPPRTRAG